MRVEINADNLFPVPGIASGMGYYKKFIGISKISAYGLSKQNIRKSCVIFSIYLHLIYYIRNLSDADLRLCLEEHSDERRIKQ